MGWLTGDEIINRCMDPEKEEIWVEIFKSQRFEDLPEGKGIGIFPFFKRNLESVTYDLTVGCEAYSLRKAKKEILDQEGELKIEPGETVLVLTQEFLALGPKFAAVTLAKATIMNQGIVLSSAKIDPTWYGCLPIPITNNSRRVFVLSPGMAICALSISELSSPVKQDYYVRPSIQLGRRNLVIEKGGEVWEPVDSALVSPKDMKEALKFGPPFDIVRGMFEHTKRSIVKQIQEDWGSHAIEDLQTFIREEEFASIKKHRESEIGRLQEQNKILADFTKSMNQAICSWQSTNNRLLWTLILMVIALIISTFLSPGSSPSGG
jgi:deoxycytidine triphosphate deaminase